MDRRDEVLPTCYGGELVIAPDVVADFTEMPFDDESFWHVVFDPPHHTSKRLGETDGEIAKRFGRLSAGWPEMLQLGFKECFRVLKPNGTLIFKWGSSEIPLSRVLKLAPMRPLYGHISSKAATTHWVAFIKHNSKDRSSALGDD